MAQRGTGKQRKGKNMKTKAAKNLRVGDRIVDREGVEFTVTSVSVGPKNVGITARESTGVYMSGNIEGLIPKNKLVMMSR